MNDLKDIPLPLIITMFLFLALMGFFGLSTSYFGTASFLKNQMILNFLLAVILSFMYGIICLVVPPEHALNKYQGVILPILLIGSLWFRAYFTYVGNMQMFCRQNVTETDQTLSTKSYRPQILLWNTSKIAIAIFVVYIFVTLCSWTLTPFFELFGSAHPLIYFFGVGFWVGCSTWAAETSGFFAIQRDGCVPLEDVSFTDLDSKISELPDPLNGET